MKTLIVKYLPRAERSNTKKLLDIFTKHVSEYDELDITQEHPDMFDKLRLNSYVKRNYANQDLTQTEKESLARMDRMTQQLKNADITVLAFPMHNFSLPAPVKAWFDSVMQKEETWTTQDKKYKGLLNSKALILMSSGGKYTGQNEKYNHATALAELEFTFMGMQTETVTIQGTNADPENIGPQITAANTRIGKIVQEWYKK